MTENNPAPAENLITSQEVADQLKSVLDPSKSIADASSEAETEMSAEDQQMILKQILGESQKRSALGYFKKPGKMVSPNAEKKRKAKNKQQRNSRKANRKK